ncbi:Metallo-hydrolase/oxidoreductase [Pluteus cervinus]|uniref:Metallo-hydrolase/oxidoreductase n=1 Tax=Pluteus cervinus TaxID=181527 RepID=A0ACD3BAA2_9AGAR|nr:Metallo-hydrolase/oxidoreductase [Pluteus cervinus]
MTSNSLPAPVPNQAYCDVSALEAGHIDLPDGLFFHPSSPGAISHPPSLAFLLRHSSNEKTLVFDLGLRKDWEENSPPAIVQLIKEVYSVRIPQDVAESVTRGGLNPSSIDTVCVSHCHFDHTGDPRPFTDATFILGGESSSLISPSAAYPANPTSMFHSDLFPLDRTQFLYPTDEWKPLGPFAQALDFYGDGSLYIVDSPGHLPGHLTILARTSSDGGWIYLAGDSAHHWCLLTGEAHVSVSPEGRCAHHNKELAEVHIRRIGELLELPRVKVIIAHDEPWYTENKDGPAFFPGKIPAL